MLTTVCWWPFGDFDNWFHLIFRHSIIFLKSSTCVVINSSVVVFSAEPEWSCIMTNRLFFIRFANNLFWSDRMKHFRLLKLDKISENLAARNEKFLVWVSMSMVKTFDFRQFNHRKRKPFKVQLNLKWSSNITPPLTFANIPTQMCSSLSRSVGAWDSRSTCLSVPMCEFQALSIIKIQNGW